MKCKHYDHHLSNVESPYKKRIWLGKIQNMDLQNRPYIEVNITNLENNNIIHDIESTHSQ